jgi:flagellar assembly protein FliH
MSSKLHRGGGVETEPIAWRRVSSLDAITGDGHTSSSYAVEPGVAAGPRRVGEAEQNIRAAHQQGYEEGQAAVRQSLTGQLEAMQAKLARSIEELAGLRARYRREAEQDIVQLALAVARRILHRELTMAPDALLGLVKAALERIEAREVHHVRVAREDAAMVSHFFEQMGLPHRIEVIADPGLERGGAILESNRGLLDASVDTQLKEIERGFADLVRRAP